MTWAKLNSHAVPMWPAIRTSQTFDLDLVLISTFMKKSQSRNLNKFAVFKTKASTAFDRE